MTKIKKALCLILASSMCLPFAGCGDKKEPASSKDVTTVTIWSGDTGAKVAMTEIVDEYNSTIGKEKGIKIEYDAKDDFGQQLELALQAGVGPDIYQSANSEIYGGKGYCVPLEDIDGGSELLAQYEGFVYPDWYVDRTSGKHYSVPYKSITYGLIYNKDMFKKAGIVDKKGEAKPPKTFDEMREYAKKLTDTKKKQYGIVLPVKWPGWLQSDILNVAAADTGLSTGYNPETGEYDIMSIAPTMECIMGLKNDGSVYPGAETLDNDPARARFAEGGIGMKISASYDVAVFNTQFPAKFDWGVAPLPVSDADNCYKQPVGYSPAGSINSQKSTMDKMDKVFEVYKWLASKEFAQRCYKDGVLIPYRYEDVKGIKIDGKNLKGWKEFADMLEISIQAPSGRKLTTAGKKTLQQICVEEIYSGKTTVKDGLSERQKIVDEGIKAYLADYPDYDYTKGLVPDWFDRAKR